MTVIHADETPLGPETKPSMSASETSSASGQATSTTSLKIYGDEDFERRRESPPEPAEKRAAKQVGDLFPVRVAYSWNPRCECSRYELVPDRAEAQKVGPCATASSANDSSGVPLAAAAAAGPGG